MNMHFEFAPFQTQHLPLWDKWIKLPFIKETWFVEGYQPADYIHQKITGNGYDYPFVIMADDQPIGYIVCCDLYAYRKLCPEPKGLFTNETPGTFCVDLFIAEEDYLNRGYGTAIMQRFIHKLIDEFGAKKIVIDPAATNKRAIRCYEKAGFKFIRLAHDGITECHIMQYDADIEKSAT